MSIKRRFTKEELRQFERNESTSKWKNLGRVRDIPAFSAWLTDDFHGWQGQSPDEGELLRIFKDGTTLTVYWDKNAKQTVCGRHLMLLWHIFDDWEDFD